MSVSSSAGGRRETPVTHKRGVVFIRVAGNNEVGFIIKPNIALATNPKSVLIPVRSKRTNLFTGVELVTENSNKFSSLGPVVGRGGRGGSSSSSSHSVVRS